MLMQLVVDRASRVVMADHLQDKMKRGSILVILHNNTLVF